MSLNHFVAFLFRTWLYFPSMLPRRDVRSDFLIPVRERDCTSRNVACGIRN